MKGGDPPAGEKRERLHKLIARTGLASRRAAEALIAEGRVRVDGEVATIGLVVDPACAKVDIDGRPLPGLPPRVYYLLHKPLGVVSSVSDPFATRTVVELVPLSPRVYPVGRLDADSTGLLLLCNDGELTNLLTHPRYGVTKTYRVEVRGAPGADALDRMRTGVMLDDGPAAAKNLRVVGTRPETTELEVVMGEGRNREIRRMCEAIGHPVVALERIAIGPLRDPHLPRGRYRLLTKEQVAALYAAARSAAG